MRVDIVMPQMGESVVEGTIVKWTRKVGDLVQKDETLLEISTDKVDSEIPSPATGTLVEIAVQAGQKVAVGTVLARLETEASEAKGAIAGASKAAPAQQAAPPATPSAPQATPPVQAAPQQAAPQRNAAPSAPAQRSFTPPPAEPRSEGPGLRAVDTGKRFYSPLVRSIARSENVSNDELDTIPGTGLGGRVTKQDIQGWLENRGGGGGHLQPATYTRTSPQPAAAPAQAPAQAPVQQQAAPQSYALAAPSGAPAPAGVEVVAMDSMRRSIAEHMVRSVHTSPHVTIYHEVDMTRIVKWREKNAKAFEAREGIKLTFTPFFVEAAVHALRKHPWVNASVDGTNVLVKKQLNVGIAVALDNNGLIVPVIKGADGLSFTGLCRSVVDLATRARGKKLQPAEIQDGTFTITNLGVFGSSFGSPIINQPQVAILGVGAIKKSLVVQKDDSIAIRSMMFLMLSIDHRVVDGALGGQFLKSCADYLEGFDDSRSI